MKQNKTAAIYCRTASKDDTAIEMQRYLLRRLASEQGFDKILEFTDNGVKGLTLDRPGFNALNRAIAAGKVGTVYVKDFSRIGREWTVAGQWLEKMRKQCIRVISAVEGELTQT
jgi:DNA invertase Pin-like site-specific DNA recombinase